LISVKRKTSPHFHPSHHHGPHFGMYFSLLQETIQSQPFHDITLIFTSSINIFFKLDNIFKTNLKTFISNKNSKIYFKRFFKFYNLKKFRKNFNLIETSFFNYKMVSMSGIGALPGRPSVFIALIHRNKIFTFVKNLHSIPQLFLV